MPNGSQYDPDDDEDFGDDGSNLVKDLRKQNKDLARENKKLADSLGQFLSQQRSKSLNEALAAKGLNPAAAKFYPADADLTDDAIASWITENADVFGGPVQVQQTDDSGDTTPGDSGESQAPDGAVQVVPIPSFIAPEDRAAFRRMQSAQLVGTTATTRDAEFLQQMKQAKTPDELAAVLRSQTTRAT